MKRFLKTIIRTPAPTTERVHFHVGADGPYVCDFADCDSPGMDPAALNGR